MVNSGNGSAFEKNRILDTGHESRVTKDKDKLETEVGAEMSGLSAEMRRDVAFN